MPRLISACAAVSASCCDSDWLLRARRGVGGLGVVAHAQVVAGQRHQRVLLAAEPDTWPACEFIVSTTAPAAGRLRPAAWRAISRCASTACSRACAAARPPGRRRCAASDSQHPADHDQPVVGGARAELAHQRGLAQRHGDLALDDAHRHQRLVGLRLAARVVHLAAGARGVLEQADAFVELAVVHRQVGRRSSRPSSAGRGWGSGARRAAPPRSSRTPRAPGRRTTAARPSACRPRRGPRRRACARRCR